MQNPSCGDLPKRLQVAQHVDCVQQSSVSLRTLEGEYIASSAGSTAVAVNSAMDGIDDNGMTRHSEVIVCSPDTNSLLCIFSVGIREFSSKLRSVNNLQE